MCVLLDLLLGALALQFSSFLFSLLHLSCFCPLPLHLDSCPFNFHPPCVLLLPLGFSLHLQQKERTLLLEKRRQGFAIVCGPSQLSGPTLLLPLACPVKSISNYMDYIENFEMIESEFDESLKISTDCL